MSITFDPQIELVMRVNCNRLLYVRVSFTPKYERFTISPAGPYPAEAAGCGPLPFCKSSVIPFSRPMLSYCRA
jgi:hypothetical protein